MRICATLGLALVTFVLGSPVWGQCTDGDSDGFFYEPACGTGLDCDDGDPARFPGAAEVCDGFDQDCDGYLDNDIVCDRVCDVPQELPAVSAPPLDVHGDATWNGQGFAAVREDCIPSDCEAGSDIHVLRFDLQGSLLGETNVTNAVPGLQTNDDAHIVWDGSGYGIIWREFNTSLPDARKFQRLDQAGNLVGNAIDLGPFVNVMGPETAIAWSGNGYAVARGTQGVQIMALDRFGNPLSPFTNVSGPSNDLPNLSIVWTGSIYAVVWADSFEETLGLRLVDRTGVPVGPVRTLAPAAEFGDGIGMAWNGVELGVAWDHWDGSQYNVQFLRVGASGTPLGSPITLYSTSTSIDWVQVATSGAEFLVAWHVRNELVRLARIDAFGNMLGSVVATTVAPGNRDSWFVEWTGSDYAIYAESQLTRISCGCTMTDLDTDGLTSCDGDCDDGSAAVSPGASQLCDGVNNDCDDAAWPFVAPSEFDVDTDTYRVCDGDCDDGDALTHPGAPQLCDGINNDCSDASWPTVPSNELDVDADGLRGCDGDCDDSSASTFPAAPQLCDGVNNDCNDADWPAVPANEADSDADGFRICANDCNDLNPGVNPDAIEICNGLDDDCNTLTDEDVLGEDSDGDGVFNLCDNCPQIFNSNQFDEDNDGIGNSCDNCLVTPNPDQHDRDADSLGDACDNCPVDANPGQGNFDGDPAGDACDCALTDADVYPGAVEINDAADNQCPGDLGFGVIDETSGSSGFNNPTDNTAYSWTPQAGATNYEVARSDAVDFLGTCLVFTTSSTVWIDSELPNPAGAAFFYLNRPIAPNPGSWGQESSGAERTAVCP